MNMESSKSLQLSMTETAEKEEEKDREDGEDEEGIWWRGCRGACMGSGTDY